MWSLSRIGVEAGGKRSGVGAANSQGREEEGTSLAGRIERMIFMLMKYIMSYTKRISGDIEVQYE